MCLFSVGGNLGYALGPIVTTPLVLAFGLTGGLLLAIPCLAVAAMLVAVRRRTCSASRPPAARTRRPPARTGRGALVLLLGVIAFRSVAWFGLITFVPLWEVSLGHSKAYGTHLLSLMLLAGGARHARRRGRSPTGSAAGRCSLRACSSSAR